MIFPDGGLSEMAQSGLKIGGKILGHAGGIMLEHVGKFQELVHKSLVGGSSIPGLLQLYDDHLEFEPAIPKALMPLYRGIEEVRLDYGQIVSVEAKRVKLIFNIVDLQLREGHCLLQHTFASGADEIARVIKAHLTMRPGLASGGTAGREDRFY
jgi:hypothetical protein